MTTLSQVLQLSPPDPRPSSKPLSTGSTSTLTTHLCPPLPHIFPLLALLTASAPAGKAVPWVTMCHRKLSTGCSRLPRGSADRSASCPLPQQGSGGRRHWASTWLTLLLNITCTKSHHDGTKVETQFVERTEEVYQRLTVLLSISPCSPHKSFFF